MAWWGMFHVVNEVKHASVAAASNKLGGKRLEREGERESQISAEEGLQVVCDPIWQSFYHGEG